MKSLAKHQNGRAKLGDTIDRLEHPRLELDRVTLQTPNYQRTLITGVSLAVDKGRELLIVGASGGGKSSLLCAIAGLWNSGSGGELKATGPRCPPVNGDASASNADPVSWRSKPRSRPPVLPSLAQLLSFDSWPSSRPGDRRQVQFSAASLSLEDPSRFRCDDPGCASRTSCFSRTLPLAYFGQLPRSPSPTVNKGLRLLAWRIWW